MLAGWVPVGAQRELRDDRRTDEGPASRQVGVRHHHRGVRRGHRGGAGFAGFLYTLLTGAFGDQLLERLFKHVMGLLGIG